MREVILRTLEDTAAFAREFAQTLKCQDVVLFSGDLGAGKSEICRQIIKSLCGFDTQVPSPTFTLMQEYQSPNFPIYHFDLYRIEHPEEVYELGIEDCAHQGLCLIEWPERLQGLKFGREVLVRVDVMDDGERVVRIVSH